MARQICVIPAHNEAASIHATLHSVADQTRPLDLVVVVADNCTDDTELIASEYAKVITTRDNTDMKAGALNQALDQLIPDLNDDDCILIMDADTTIVPDFVGTAEKFLRANPRIGGVSSIFTAKPAENLLGMLQSMEFFRYRRQIHRNGNRAYVLSGTASVVRVGALRAVKTARGNRLPDGGGGYYDTSSLTEDNELTFALLLLGYQCVAPGVLSTTDIMPDLGRLYRQRHRWYLGALRNLREYGRRMPWYMRFTYWRQQFGLLLSLLVTAACTAVLVAIVRGGGVVFSLWSLPAIGLLALERTVTVWPMGWRARVIAATLVLEQAYAVLLTLCYASAFKDFVRGRKGHWHAT